MHYWLLLALRKTKAHIHNFPGYPAVHGLFRGTARARCICIHPSQAARTGRFMGLEKESYESASSQHGYWPGETGTLVSLRGLCPFFGLVIHPNGLEIMRNHNNNSQLNKTSINRNNNWGWEEKWPLGILFWRDLRLWFPRQRRWQISQCDSLFLEKETNHIFPVAKAVELNLLQKKEWDEGVGTKTKVGYSMTPLWSFSKLLPQKWRISLGTAYLYLIPWEGEGCNQFPEPCVG